ncbi:MAG: HlyD family efflux transporter periplasmic adaptor subunit [Treponema sp.]|uniref:efflux RND transporter periplasmic adaptor subunit n=1 Tax=Treponema sp. TaxID=166 RepID=UPI00298DF704|nr:HlyD family efflux transporter periplasmic adaptor subunit [Treponema sp.]MCR5387431.1 HlyD family efflux transporter periplasmic adaptor subunit [Treponema sp.]
MTKKMKLILISALSLAGVILLLFVVRAVITKVNTKPVFYTVKKENYENVIEISGTVEAAQEQTLQALSDGTVLGVYVKEGDRVKKGDVIIQLDDTTQVYNLEKHDFNMAATRITGSAREIKLMQTERLSLLQKVSDRKVSATFDGVIAALDVAVGDSLEAKDSVGTLVNVDYLLAEVEVAETDVSQLKVGQQVEFSFNAYKDKTVYGTVIGWPAIGEITSRGATVVKVKIKIEDFPPEILPNYSFTGKIKIADPEEYLLVERYAIGYENKKPYVVTNKSSKKIDVKVVPYGNTMVKIVEGDVKEGDVLVQQSKPKMSGLSKNRGGMMGPPGGMGARPPRM